MPGIRQACLTCLPLHPTCSTCPWPSPSLFGMPGLYQAFLACLEFAKPAWHAYPFTQPALHAWPSQSLPGITTCLASLALHPVGPADMYCTFTQPVEYLAPYPACLALRIACTVYLALDSKGSGVKYLLLYALSCPIIFGPLPALLPALSSPGFKCP